MFSNKLPVLQQLHRVDRILNNFCQCVFLRGVADGGGERLATDSERKARPSKISQDIVYRLVSPGRVSSSRVVPDDSVKPDYVTRSRLSKVIRERVAKRRQAIEIKSASQIQGMRDACRVAREILNSVGEKVYPGVTTDELDVFVHDACIARYAYPSPLSYRGFPKSVCTSVNNVACHGIPDDRPLCDGDIVNIDVTVFYGGFHGDVSETFPVGKVDDMGLHLINIAKQCRDRGISVCGPGQRFNLIGKTIRQTADEGDCRVIPVFCGHGIGSFFHGPPDIIHIDNDLDGVMKEGMTFTVEPVITDGNPAIAILDDGWTAITKDGSRSAQFEHTILITKDGVDILTV